MNHYFKKENNSRLTYYSLTYLSIFFLIFFTLQSSLIAEPNSSEVKNTSSSVSNSSEEVSNDNIAKSNNSSSDTVEKENSDSPVNSEKETIQDTKKQKEEFLKKIKELENQRRKLSFEIYQLRVKLIKEDPELQSLQRSIMDMHRKMASKLNEKNSIKVLLDKAQQIDSEITETINKNKSLEPKELSIDKSE